MTVVQCGFSVSLFSCPLIYIHPLFKKFIHNFKTVVISKKTWSAYDVICVHFECDSTKSRDRD